MIGFGDNTETHGEVRILFNVIHPNGVSILQLTVTRAENKFLGETSLRQTDN